MTTDIAPEVRFDTSPITDDELAELAATFRGELIRPGDRDYDLRREVWNGMVAKQPSLIARVRGSSDIKGVISFARRMNRALAVRSGGHNAAGKGTVADGVVLDMTLMRGVRVDPERRVARVEGGAMWGDLDREGQQYGLATPGGVISTTGVAGLTLGGGLGWLTRRFGFSCENVLSMDLITADGEHCVCSADSHPDLYWALRGGGGNFGVVTSFEFQMHPVGPQVVGGMIGWRSDDAAEVMRWFEDNAQDLPVELGLQVNLVGMQPAPFVPEDLWNTRVLACIFGWSGEPDTADPVLQRILGVRTPAFSGISTHTWADQQSMLDPWAPFGRFAYYKSGSIKELTPAVTAVAVARAAVAPSLVSMEEFFLQGARPHRDEDTAYSDGGYPWIVNVVSHWDGPTDHDEIYVGWARQTLAEILDAGESGGVYTNFLNEDEGARVATEAFSPATYARLQQVKARYDPANVFRINPNIVPAARS